MISIDDEWRLLDFECPDTYHNLALEEVLARSVSQGISPNTLRFWRNPPSAVIGRYQNIEAEVDLAACRKLGVAVVRRFTGGGAVYHDLGNLNCTLVFQRPRPNHALELFQLFCEGIIEALGDLKIQAHYAPPNSILVHERKVAGAAASLRWRTNFVHGSILANTESSRVWKFLRNGNNKKQGNTGGYVRSRITPVVSLREILLREVLFEALKERLVRSFERLLQVNLVANGPSLEEIERTQLLFEERYSSDSWNLGVDPRALAQISK